MSKGLLSSSASVVACTRGGRPGGSITGRVGMGLEVRVTGTTATGAMGESAAAIGTSGFMSEGTFSEAVASLYVGVEAFCWSAGGGTRGASCAEASSSIPDSARPFKALGATDGEAAKVRWESKRGLSVLGV